MQGTGSMPRRAIIVLALTAWVATSMTLDAAGVGAADAKVIRVPQDEKTIQAAVDAARPGTLVLVSPGVYHEAVTVTPEHENIVIRGLDRTKTIVDGDFAGDPDHQSGFEVSADGVAIENLTARNFSVDGFIWTGVDGYRGSYLSAVRNGVYGIVASDSVHGQFDHSYASGSPDAGFFVAACFPCDALVVDSKAEWNGFGFAATNAGGKLVVARSTFRDNRVGIVSGSASTEADPPQRLTTIVGNRVHDNNNGAAGAVELAEIAIGNGVLVAGGSENLVAKNRVTGHDVAGIGVVPLPETVLSADNPEAQDFDARDNTARANVTIDNQYDLLSITNIVDPTDAGGNCFTDNDYSTSLPADIEQVMPCDQLASGFTADIALFVSLLASPKPESGDYKTVALPDTRDLGNLPNAKSKKARPATDEPSIKLKLKALAVPE